jgi:hypothetical protein
LAQRAFEGLLLDLEARDEGHLPTLCSEKHLHRYLSEFDSRRVNRRHEAEMDFAMFVVAGALVGGAVGIFLERKSGLPYLRGGKLVFVLGLSAGVGVALLLAWLTGTNVPMGGPSR